MFSAGFLGDEVKIVSGSHTQFLTTTDALPEGDYVSPGLEIVCPDRCFPHIGRGDKLDHPWPYLRREVPHNWYCDRRYPEVGFLNRDEVMLLYNLALQFSGKPGLEIGCWMGWSTCSGVSGRRPPGYPGGNPIEEGVR